VDTRAIFYIADVTLILALLVLFVGVLRWDRGNLRRRPVDWIYNVMEAVLSVGAYHLWKSGTISMLTMLIVLAIVLGHAGIRGWRVWRERPTRHVTTS
jgi:hypothetical protein